MSPFFMGCNAWITVPHVRRQVPWEFYILCRYLLAILSKNLAGNFLFSAGTSWPLLANMYPLGTFWPIWATLWPIWAKMYRLRVFLFSAGTFRPLWAKMYWLRIIKPPAGTFSPKMAKMYRLSLQERLSALVVGERCFWEVKVGQFCSQVLLVAVKEGAHLHGGGRAVGACKRSVWFVSAIGVLLLVDTICGGCICHPMVFTKPVRTPGSATQPAPPVKSRGMAVQGHAHRST